MPVVIKIISLLEILDYIQFARLRFNFHKGIRIVIS